MPDIVLSAGVRQNLLSLQNTANLMATTQNRLATGKKVNTALDNPTNFFTSESLKSRASDLNALLDSMSNGTKTLQAADNGITAIIKNIETMQSTLRQARQDKTFETASYSVNSVDPSALPAPQLTFVGGAFSGATNFGLTTTAAGQYKTTSAAYAAPAAAGAATYASNAAIDLNGAAQAGGTLTIALGTTSVTVTVPATTGVAGDATTIRDAINDGLVGTALDGLVSASVTGNGITLTGPTATDGAITVTGTAETSVFGTQDATDGSDGSWNFSINGTAITLDATTGADVDTAVSTINATLQNAGVKFQAWNSGGKLGIRATTTDAGSLTIGGADANLFGTPGPSGTVSGTTSMALTLAATVDDMVSTINADTDLNTKIKASNDNGKLRIQNLSTESLTIMGANDSGQITGTNTVETSIVGNKVRTSLATQYNDLRDQLDKLADDASYNGINLLRGDLLTLTFNDSGTSTINIQARDVNNQPTQIDAQALGVSTLAASDLDSDTSIDSLLATLKDSLDTLRSHASNFGSNLSIVENRTNFTKAMMNTLETGADALTLADGNEEAANMLALQTRQQLSSTALSMAAQADQAVLRLFNG